MPVAGTQSAYTVAEVDAIRPACALHRSVMHGEDHAVSLLQLDNLRAGLHARPLLRQYELTPGEVLTWDRQQEGDLQGKHMFSVEILVQAIVIALAVLEEKGGVGFVCPAL
jgi:hypothetical protein